MNESQTIRVQETINDLGTIGLSGIDYLLISREFLSMNPKLIKDYPSLEDAINALNQVILTELD